MARATTPSVPVSGPSPTRPRRAHWQALLAAWRRSGLSQAEFCRRHELAPGTFAWWKHTLGRGGTEARAGAKPSAPARAVVAPAFVPVRVVTAPTAPPTPPAPVDATLEIVLARGRLVRVHGRVDAPWLAAVVAALEAPAC